MESDDHLRDILEKNTIWNLMLYKVKVTRTEDGVMNLLLREVDAIIQSYKELVHDCLTLEYESSQAVSFPENLCLALGLEIAGPWYLRNDLSDYYSNLLESDMINNDPSDVIKKEIMESEDLNLMASTSSSFKEEDDDGHQSNDSNNDSSSSNKNGSGGKTCPKCFKTYAQKKVFKRHIEICNKPMDAPHCNKCLKVMPSMTSLRKHISLCGRSIEKEDESIKAERRTCPDCSEVFTSLKERMAHHKTCEKVDRVQYPEMTCSICNAKFNKFYYFKMHIDNCSKQKIEEWKGFLCRRCYHVIPGIEGQQPHQCNFIFKCVKCPFTASNDTKYRFHYFGVHTNKSTSAQCDTCGKTFNSSNELRKHSICHSQDKRFVCTECGRRFGRIDSLKRHRSVHYVENHPCNICGRMYGSLLKLKKHKQAMHPSAAGIVPCPHCVLTFENQNGLMKHVKTKHKNEVQVCVFCHGVFPCKMSYTAHYEGCLQESKEKNRLSALSKEY